MGKARRDPLNLGAAEGVGDDLRLLRQAGGFLAARRNHILGTVALLAEAMDVEDDAVSLSQAVGLLRNVSKRVIERYLADHPSPGYRQHQGARGLQILLLSRTSLVDQVGGERGRVADELGITINQLRNAENELILPIALEVAAAAEAARIQQRPPESDEPEGDRPVTDPEVDHFGSESDATRSLIGLQGTEFMSYLRHHPFEISLADGARPVLWKRVLRRDSDSAAAAIFLRHQVLATPDEQATLDALPLADLSVCPVPRIRGGMSEAIARALSKRIIELVEIPQPDVLDPIYFGWLLNWPHSHYAAKEAPYAKELLRFWRWVRCGIYPDFDAWPLLLEAMRFVLNSVEGTEREGLFPAAGWDAVYEDLENLRDSTWPGSVVPLRTRSVGADTPRPTVITSVNPVIALWWDGVLPLTQLVNHHLSKTLRELAIDRLGSSLSTDVLTGWLIEELPRLKANPCSYVKLDRDLSPRARSVALGDKWSAWFELAIRAGNDSNSPPPNLMAGAIGVHDELMSRGYDRLFRDRDTYEWTTARYILRAWQDENEN